MCKHFTNNFTVFYRDLGQNGLARPETILDYLEETAIIHSHSLGVGFEMLKDRGLGWVLNQWKLRINHYPTWRDTVTVETWPSSFNKFYATREFIVRDKNKGIIAYASSLWLLLDLAKRRPIKVPPEVARYYKLDENRAIDKPFTKIRYEASSQETARQFSVRQGDIDTNNHVNNKQYVSWMLEAVPLAVRDSYTLKGVDIAYRKEAVYGQDILSLCSPESNTVNFSHSVQLADANTGIATGRTYWQ